MHYRSQPAELRELLRRYRLESGLTQESLAERAGLGVRSIQALESGERRPRRETVQRLAEALELAVERRAELEALAQPSPRRTRLAVAPPVDDLAAQSKADSRSAGGAASHRSRGVLSTPTPHSSASTTPSNLPPQLTSFVGRERELAEVRRLLGTTRLLTLTGTGGCGKTRLAYQVAEGLLRERPADYPDGVWVVELAALTDPTLVVQAVASTLDVREISSQPILQTLLSHLKSKRLLLVLDNCEHLLDACARLADSLLRTCPQVELLATSREPLGIAGETSYRVPSLSLPDPRQPPSLERLSRYEAVSLFVERAAAAKPTFALTEQNAPAVAQVCWRLDGIPLALELAAARVRGLAVEQIADLLDDRFRLLTGGSRTALRRQQTLRATIDWSHDLLTAPERVLLRRLAVFVGGFTLEAADSVCSGESQGMSIERADVLGLLLQLVERSLVVADESSGESRYRLLETIRQYAQEKLVGSGETTAISDRHLDWCLALVEQAAPELNRRGQLSWLDRLEREHDNLRVALQWSLAREESSSTALRLAAALGSFWLRSDHVAEMREQLRLVLARPGGDPAARARALRYGAMAESWAGHWRKARDWHGESLVLARLIGDNRLIASALLGLSWVEFDVGDYVEAQALQEEALEISREIGDRHSIGDTLIYLTLTLWMLGEDERVRTLAEEGLGILKDVGDLVGVAWLLARLSSVALAAGDTERAQGFAEASLSQASSAGLIARSHGLCLLGDIARAEGDNATAEAFYREALVEYRQLTVEGDWSHTTAWLLNMAGIWVAQGQYLLAAQLYGAVGGWQRTMDLPAPWCPPRGYDRDLAMAREALGDEAFARAWAEGQAMSLEEAVEYALQDVVETT